jgi:short-subunit dehydrogenase
VTQENLPLTGKAALITGASSGLGRALAIEMANRGAGLLLAARNQDRLGQAAQQAGAYAHGDVVIQPCDVGDQGQVDALATEAERAFGGLDILINNAGIGRAGKVAESDTDAVRQMLGVNLWGLYLVTRACLPLVSERRGWVVNISSVAALNPSPGFAMYAASKAAVSSFSRSLRQELRLDGVRVLDVCPGMMGTAFFDGFTASGKPPVPTDAGPLLDPADAAHAICDALCLPENAAVNELVIRPAWQER